MNRPAVRPKGVKYVRKLLTSEQLKRLESLIDRHVAAQVAIASAGQEQQDALKVEGMVACSNLKRFMQTLKARVPAPEQPQGELNVPRNEPGETA